MPIEIPAGQTINFDVVVNAVSPGDSEMDFNLFVESQNQLLIERIHHPLKVFDSGRTQPDWIVPAIDTSAGAKQSNDDQPSASTEIESDQEMTQVVDAGEEKK